LRAQAPTYGCIAGSELGRSRNPDWGGGAPPCAAGNGLRKRRRAPRVPRRPPAPAPLLLLLCRGV